MPKPILLVMRVILISLLAVLLAFGLFFVKKGDGVLREDDAYAVQIAEALEIEIPEGSTCLRADTHGGFQGDGETFALVTLTKAPAGLEGWPSLPIPDELRPYALGELVVDGLGNHMEAAAEARNGYYFFRDRFAEKYPEQATASLSDRPAQNYTAAVYDADAGLLYFYQLDT